MKLRRWVLSALAPLLCSAQTPAPAQPEPEVVTHQAPATFSSRVNLVSVPVVIRDKDGHAVGGMKQEDFQLFDKGKPQVITKFSIQTGSAGVVAGEAAARSASAGAPKSAETASSRPELPDRYVAYLFDDIHMQPGDLLNARQAANKHLATALDSGMRAGIFTTSGRTTLGFTDDAAKLHETVNKIQPWTSSSDKTECLQISYYLADILINKEHSLRPGSIDTNSMLALEIANEANDCEHNPHDADPTEPLRYAWQIASIALQQGIEETTSGLNVLRDLVSKMSSLPGSRTMVLVSPGFIVSGDQRFEESQIFENAVRANVVINSLDIRGVATPLRSHTYSAEFGGNFGGPPNGNGAPMGFQREKVDREELAEAGNVLHELADGTGGSTRDDNDFADGLKQLASRPEYIYVLGFSPDDLKFDGSYHGLKVKLKEAARYGLEARRGYWAPSRSTDPAETAREELKEAFFSRDEISNIPLDVHADFFKPGGGQSEVNVVARLDAKGLKFSKTGERNNDTLTVVTGLFDRNGNYVSGIERLIEMHLRDQSLEALSGAGISVEQNFTVAPGSYIVRVVVKDGDGQTTAARNTGIEVP